MKWTNELGNQNGSTLYNVILRIARNLLETRENVKISTYPFYHTNLDWFLWEWSKKKSKFFFFFFLNKKFKMADFSKCIFYLFLPLCQTASWPYRLSWINGLRINQFYWPKDQPVKFSQKSFENWRFWKMAILKNGDFEKWRFWKMAILKNWPFLIFFFKKKFFCFILMKISPNLYGRLKGSKDVFPGFQQITCYA